MTESSKQGHVGRSRHLTPLVAAPFQILDSPPPTSPIPSPTSHSLAHCPPLQHLSFCSLNSQSSSLLWTQHRPCLLPANPPQDSLMASERPLYLLSLNEHLTPAPCSPVPLQPDTLIFFLFALISICTQLFMSLFSHLQSGSPLDYELHESKEAAVSFLSTSPMPRTVLGTGSNICLMNE